jgi:hypothetical protein
MRTFSGLSARCELLNKYSDGTPLSIGRARRIALARALDDDSRPERSPILVVRRLEAVPFDAGTSVTRMTLSTG